MIVEGNKVKWNYGIAVNEFHGTETEATTCTILDNKDEVLLEATVLRKKGINSDPCCKDSARKFSLAKAIADLSKEERAKYWEAYRTMNPKPRWNTV